MVEAWLDLLEANVQFRSLGRNEKQDPEEPRPQVPRSSQAVSSGVNPMLAGAPAGAPR